MLLLPRFCSPHSPPTDARSFRLPTSKGMLTRNDCYFCHLTDDVSLISRHFIVLPSRRDYVAWLMTKELSFPFNPFFPLQPERGTRHLPNLTLPYLFVGRHHRKKQNTHFRECYACFGCETKTGVVRILVIFHHRPMSSHIRRKRPFERYG